MLVAQITDIHLGFVPGKDDEPNRGRLERVLHRLSILDRMPDLLFATGDLVDRGDRESYRRLRRALDACPLPVRLCVGNHDDRANLRAVFPEVPTSDGFVQYVVETGPVRFVVIDTLEPGRHGGAFCEVRARWLHDTLAAAPDRPTMIVMHHPPIDTGIDWMTTHPGEPWVARLRAALAGHRRIVGIICGHIHRNVAAGWAGCPLTVCASTAPQVALTLAPIDGEHADGRPMILAGPPAYALHHWNGQEMVSHFDAADSPAVVARYCETMEPVVRGMLNERPSR